MKTTSLASLVQGDSLDQRQTGQDSLDKVRLAHPLVGLACQHMKRKNLVSLLQDSLDHRSQHLRLSEEDCLETVNLVC